MGAIADRPLSPLDIIAPLVAAVVFIGLASLLREPARRRFMAIFVAGAGAAYLNGGFGVLELPYILVATYVAYRGLDSYRFIGVAWLMHTGWDVAHHLYGQPIWHWAPTSSAGCAIMDAALAAWFLAAACKADRTYSPGASDTWFPGREKAL